jgi:TnpA family transposase
VKSWPQKGSDPVRPSVNAQQDRKTWAVQPQKYIDESVVRDHWENILRLVVTIKLKQASASDIFRRLNTDSAGKARKGSGERHPRDPEIL